MKHDGSNMKLNEAQMEACKKAISNDRHLIST